MHAMRGKQAKNRDFGFNILSICLRGRVTKTHTVLNHSVVHSSNDRNSKRWANQNPGAGIFPGVSHMSAGARVLGPSPLPSQGHQQGSGPEVESQDLNWLPHEILVPQAAALTSALAPLDSFKSRVDIAKQAYNKLQICACIVSSVKYRIQNTWKNTEN